MNKYTIEGNKERLGLGSTRWREIGEKPRERGARLSKNNRTASCTQKQFMFRSKHIFYYCSYE